MTSFKKECMVGENVENKHWPIHLKIQFTFSQLYKITFQEKYVRNINSCFCLHNYLQNSDYSKRENEYVSSKKNNLWLNINCGNYVMFKQYEIRKKTKTDSGIMHPRSLS